VQRIALNAHKIEQLKHKIAVLEQEFHCSHPCEGANIPPHALLALHYLHQRLADLEAGEPEGDQANLARDYIQHAFISLHNRKGHHQGSLESCGESASCSDE